jgi:phosphoribosyl-AMP cyclohydrolase
MTNRDETTVLSPKYDSNGLIGAIVQDATDHTVLMFAHMNAEAIAKTHETGIVHFWSRSRGNLWKKGETSGETFRVVEMRIDCDQDCLLVLAKAEGKGNACHTGRRSCFYRRVNDNTLTFV